MRASWKVFVDAPNERSGRILLKSVLKTLEVEPAVVRVDPYHKGGFVLAFSTSVAPVMWPEAVVELLTQAQRLSHSWQFSGEISEELDARSNESNIPGVLSVHLQCRKDVYTDPPPEPDWIALALSEMEAFPWSHAIQWDIATFFEAYTLHDSSWVALVADPRESGDVVAVTSFLDVCIRHLVPRSEPFVPTLLIRFHGVSEVHLSGYPVGSEYSDISHVEAVEIDDRRHWTAIHNGIDGRCELLHEGRVSVVCLSAAGEVLHLPNLAV